MGSLSSQNQEKSICRLVEKDDFPEIIKLMKRLRIPIAGLYSRAIYTAICRQALKDDRIVFVVAENQGKLIGLVFAIIDRNRFLISFLLRNPLFALQILFRKFLRIMRIGVSERVPNPAQLEVIRKYLTTSHSGRSWWKDSSPQIAKAGFIAVDSKYRRSGVGFKLNRYRDKVLMERGVKRYDGIVELHRFPQIQLLYKTGFRIERRGNKFFVSKDLLLK
jgi:ribosomal protein S18 acetylase RimI-like enzyme